MKYVFTEKGDKMFYRNIKDNTPVDTIFRRYSSIFPVLLLLLHLINIPAVLEAKELKISLMWQVNKNTLLESSATVADINNDGKDEILIAGREEVIALQKQGKELWQYKTGGRFMTLPTVLKRRGKSALIYIADNKGQFVCIDSKGKLVWQAKLDGGSVWSAAVVSDIDNDGVSDVVQTDGKGTVWAFNALNGEIKWKTKLEGEPVSPAVGDLDGDGKSEIVVSTNNGDISVLTSDGSLLWQNKIGVFSESWATSAPVIFAASDGEQYIAAVSASGELNCIDARGEVRWIYPTLAPVASSISVGDFDQDGLADIFFITQTGVIYRFDETGALLWKIDMQGRSMAAGAIVDIDNDGKMEYILSTQRGHLLALNYAGDIIYDYQFDNRTINVTPVFGNVNGGSTLEMVFTGGESGRIFCFSTAASKNTRIAWPAYRGNINNTASWFGLTSSQKLTMIPRNLNWNQIYCGEKIKFDIKNPFPSKEFLKAKAQCTAPDGRKQSATAVVFGQKGSLLLPVDFSVPGVYHFNWSLSNTKGKQLLNSKREISISPFINDRALLAHSIKILNTTAKSIEKILPLSTKALQGEAFKLQSESDKLYSLQDAAPVSDALTVRTVLDKTAQLNREAKRDLKISNVLKKAVKLGSGTSIIAFEGEYWKNRNVDKQLPSIVDNPVKIKHSLVSGEHQPVSLILFNITNRLLNVRVDIPVMEKGIKITLLHSIASPTSLGEESWDALPEMDESSVISIPALSSREVWLDIKTDDEISGEHKINIKLLALNGAGVMEAPKNAHAVAPPETDVQFVLDILPLKMAPKEDFRLCTWSHVTDQNIENLLSHGNNVFLVPQGKIKFDNNKISDIDFSVMDKEISRFKSHDVFLLITGFPAIKNDVGSESYKNDLKIYLEKLTTHLNGKGFDKEHFVFYPLDEPGVHGWNHVNRLVNFGKVVKEIDPELMMYMDGPGELPMFKEMAKVMDVWTPPYDWLAEDIPEMKIVRNSGKLKWSYNCFYRFARPTGPNIKNINLIAEFRTAAPYSFRHNSTGMGYWCYNSGGENQWERIVFEYKLIYPGRTKPVTSRHWEAVREGIEEYRILSALKNELNKDIGKDAKEKIRHLLDITLPNLVDPIFITQKMGLSREAIDDVSNEERVKAYRNEMMECVRVVVENND